MLKVQFHLRLVACGAGTLIGSAARGDDPVAELRALYPAIRYYSAGQNYRYFSGAEMTAGATEAQAASAFFAQHGAALGGPAEAGGGLDFREIWSTPSRDGRFFVFAYRQKIRGKEVDGSDIRIRVRRGTVPHVDYAAARLAGEPATGSETPAFNAQTASLIVQGLSGIQDLNIEGTPEVVVLRGNARRPDAWCWRVRTRIGEPSAFARRPTYYVDTAGPRIVYVRANVHNLDEPTPGTVEGSGTSTAYPILPYQGTSTTLVTHRIPRIRVNATVGTQSAHTFTNDNGEFSINLGNLNQSIVISSTFQNAGQWYQVFIYGGTSADFLSDSEQTTVGETTPLVLVNSQLSEEFRVAEVDTVVTANRSRDFFLQYISNSISNLSIPVYILPNRTDSTLPCNAATWPSPATPPFSYGMAFAPAYGNCWNWGTHSWAAHESGHVALYMLEFGEVQLAFHEGYADTYGNMVNDDSVQGRQQRVDGSTIRENPTSSGINCQFPIPDHTTSACTCANGHSAGQLLSGPWVRIRDKLKIDYGATTGLEYARVLFGAWSLITMGGDQDCESAHPGTLNEILSLTDDSAVAAIINNAFSAHNICSTGPCND